MPSDDVFDLPPAWRAATNTIKDLIIALHDATEVMRDVRHLLENTDFKPSA